MRGRFHIPLIIAFGVFVTSSLASARPTQTRAQPASELPGEDAKLYSCRKAQGAVSVRFKPEVKLEELLSWAMGFSCKNFVFSSRVGGRRSTVTIIAPKQMTARQAYRVFLVALQSMNLAVIPKGQVLEIVEAPQAKKQPVPLFRRSQPDNSDQVVRMVLRPRHVPVADIAAALEVMRSAHGEVKPLANAGVVLVTDYGSHIAKMVALARELDQPRVHERLYLLKARRIPVKELADTLKQVFESDRSSPASRPAPRPYRGRGRRPNTRGRPVEPSQSAANAPVNVPGPSKIIPVERSNALILVATEAAYKRAKAIVDRIDVDVQGQGVRSIHVYHVSHGKAEKIAKTLTAVIQGVRANQPGQATRRGPRPAPTALAQLPTLEGDVRLTHDETTNALVVAASLRDYHALLKVIRQLDQARRQVFIEAVILEVKAGTTRDIGVSYHGGKPQRDGSIIFGGLQQSDLKSAAPLDKSLGGINGLVAGLFGKPLAGARELLGLSVPSFGVLFHALATSSNIDVLSSPYITTVNNVPAIISVGETIPSRSAVAGAGSDGAASLVPLQSIQYRDVALTLKVTPHVNASNVISLDVELEIAELGQEDFAGLGPSWAKRTIQNTVVVSDQESIVIGGLMKDKSTVTEHKIPVLGDIPVLGALFRSRYRTKEKSNLLVVLTPHVMKDAMDRRRITRRKMRERRELVQSMNNFQTRSYLPKVDYRRKRGLIEEINRAVLQTEQEARLLREMNKKIDDTREGAIE